MEISCVVFFLYTVLSWQKKKLANFMLIKMYFEKKKKKMYFEIFLVYKPLKSGKHLEKEPSPRTEKKTHIN